MEVAQCCPVLPVPWVTHHSCWLMPRLKLKPGDLLSRKGRLVIAHYSKWQARMFKWKGYSLKGRGSVWEVVAAGLQRSFQARAPSMSLGRWLAVHCRDIWVRKVVALLKLKSCVRSTSNVVQLIDFLIYRLIYIFKPHNCNVDCTQHCGENATTVSLF